MALTNIERRDFKMVSINFINKFTNVIIKRLSSFGESGALIWCSDRLSPNTNLVVLKNRGFLHLISGFNIVQTLKI